MEEKKCPALDFCRVLSWIPASFRTRRLISPSCLAFIPCSTSSSRALATCFKGNRRGGVIYVFGALNEYPVDMWVKYRRADDPDRAHREPGWNLFSKASISAFLDAHIGPQDHRFIPFELPIDLAPHDGDPIRAWTFKDSEGRRWTTNGLQLLTNEHILEIRP